MCVLKKRLFLCSSISPLYGTGSLEIMQSRTYLSILYVSYIQQLAEHKRYIYFAYYTESERQLRLLRKSHRGRTGVGKARGQGVLGRLLPTAFSTHPPSIHPPSFSFHISVLQIRWGPLQTVYFLSMHYIDFVIFLMNKGTPSINVITIRLIQL